MSACGGSGPRELVAGSHTGTLINHHSGPGPSPTPGPRRLLLRAGPWPTPGPRRPPPVAGPLAQLPDPADHRPPRRTCAVWSSSSSGSWSSEPLETGRYRGPRSEEATAHPQPPFRTLRAPRTPSPITAVRPKEWEQGHHPRPGAGLGATSSPGRWVPWAQFLPG